MADNVIVRVPEQQFIRGEDGYSPEVTIENIDHGHSVTITDREHQEEGQTFNVLDGDSAYEQAVAGGYTGTEAQFNEELASFKSLSEETKDAAPFYAVYGQTTQAQIEAAINNKRQIYLLTAPLTESAPQAYVMPLTEKFEYQYTDGGRIVISRGYRFSITSGTNQYIAELANGWTVYTNDLTAPAQRAETAAAQALTRMNSADASAQAAAGSAGDASTAATTATTKAGEASNSATAADGSAKDAEAYAVGKRGGTDVGSSDPAYHNNSKYYAEQAGETVNTFTGTTVPAAVQTVNTAGQTQVGAVNTAGQTALTAVSGAQTAAVSAVQTESTTQQAAIQQKGEDVLDSIPSDYTELSDDVDDLKSANDYDIKTRLLDSFNSVPFYSGGGFQRGYINVSTGANVATGTSPTRARRVNTISSGNYVTLGTDDYEYTLFYFNGGYSSAEYSNVYSDWIKGGTLTLVDDKHGDRAKIVIRHPDNSQLTDAEIENFNKIFLMYSLTQKPQQITTKRNNPNYAAQLKALAEGWYAHRNDINSQGQQSMIYGNNSVLNTSSYTRQIDCSTFVGLLLRGYSFAETPYATETGKDPSSFTANSNYAWSCNPFDYSNYSKQISTSRTPVRYASQLAEMMIEQGKTVPIDRYYANIEPGDVLFFARRDEETNDWVEPIRLMHINHVALCIAKEKATSGDTATYPWKHTYIEVEHEDETNPDGVVKIKTLEQPQGDASAIFENNINTLCLVCRPDLGSI